MRKTQTSVGPGSYTIQGQFYKPSQPSFARDGLKPIKVPKNKGSIKSNFENFADDDDSDDEMQYRKQIPGPGDYQTLTSSFNRQPVAARPKSIQLFGSTVTRFGEKPVGTSLGPGEYKPRVIGKLNNSVI